MVYSDVIKNNWHLLLPKKNKYTKKDYKKLLTKQNQFEPKEVFFIVRCISIFHDTECSRFFDRSVNIVLA